MIPLPYEKRIHSQNNEDGIIEVMIDAIKDCEKIFLEIGWGDGINNMSRNLIEQGWSGVGIDVQPPSPTLSLPDNFTHLNMYVTPNNMNLVVQHTSKIFDFFSLDIDSYDYEIAKWLLENNYRPKIACLEINPRFGPTVCASFPYMEVPKVKLYRKTNIFGVSLQKYKLLWNHYGYKYFGYDSTATNVFFYNPEYVNDLSHLPIHTEDEFPYKNDDIMKKHIQEHSIWSTHEQVIYKGF